MKNILQPFINKLQTPLCKTLPNQSYSRNNNPLKSEDFLTWKTKKMKKHTCTHETEKWTTFNANDVHGE